MWNVLRVGKEREMGRDVRAGKWVQSHSWEGKEVESQTLISEAGPREARLWFDGGGDVV